VCPIVLELTAKPRPQTGLEGKFSVFHAAAAALVHGAASEPQFSDACVRDPRVVALRERVAIAPDDNCAKPKRGYRSGSRSKTVSLHVEHAARTLPGR
jgi:2-methylcitrate dehydratase PrpD